MSLRTKGKMNIPSWTGTIKAIRKSRSALDSFEEESLVSIEEKIRRRWTSSYHELSLSLDVTRVLTGIKVMHQDKIMFEGNKKDPRASQLIKLIMAILYQIEPDSFQTSKTREELEETLNGMDGALHERFHEFLVDGNFNPKLIDVLKCLSTDIFSPASHNLKSAIQEKYSFTPKDDATKCVIRLDYPKADISINHTESSVDETVDQHFYFTWETNITLNVIEGVKTLKTKVNIVGFEFGETMKAVMKRELRELFEPFIDEIGSYVILWQRNILRVPVHKDLVRLSKNLVIVDSNEKELFSDPEQVLSGVVSVSKILQVLASALNDKPVIEACERLSEFVKDQGDLSEQLIKFFQLPAFAQEGPVVKILKCISQEMIYPAVQTIRNMLYEKYPYKDVKGGWGVRVVLDAGCLSVIHTKREQSHEDNAFGFTWKLKLAFDPKMETINPTLNIVDFGWGDTLSENAKADVMNLTYSLIDADALYNQLSKKTFEQVPVAKDMVEIAKSEGFEIYNQKGDEDEPIFRTSKAFDLRKNLSDFIVHLAEAVDDNATCDAIAKKLKKFSDQIPNPKVTIDESLHQTLIGETIPKDSKTMHVIRCLRTDVVAPGHRKLRRVFPQDMPVCTVAGSWLVRVVVQDKKIIVQHSRRERGSSGNLVGIFEFRWVQSFTFDQAMVYLGSDLKIVDYSWDANISEETKQTLRRLWAPFVEWHGTAQLDTNHFTYLSANDILKCVAATLDRQPEHLIPSHLIEQLKALNDTLTSVFVPLVVVQGDGA